MTFVVGAALACLGASAPPAEFTYSNPLPLQLGTPGNEVRDPCIIHEADTYYLVFTMYPFRGPAPRHYSEPDMGSSPGIRIYSSHDLKTWTAGNWLVKSSELPNDCPYKHRLWAPEIHKIAGKFYLIFTADNWAMKKPGEDPNRGYYAYVGVADKVDGPYQHITVIPGGPCDTTLMADTDGRIYAFMPMGDLFVQQIDLSGLERGQIRFTGPRNKCVTADNADVGLQSIPNYLEGPWAMKIASRYYLLFAALYEAKAAPEDRGYWTGVAYADNPLGPWTKDRRAKFFRGGHLAVFDGPDGRPWFCYRGESGGPAHGQVCVEPFDVAPDGAIQASPPAIGERRVPLQSLTK